MNIAEKIPVTHRAVETNTVFDSEKNKIRLEIRSVSREKILEYLQIIGSDKWENFRWVIYNAFRANESRDICDDLVGVLESERDSSLLNVGQIQTETRMTESMLQDAKAEIEALQGDLLHANKENDRLCKDFIGEHLAASERGREIIDLEETISQLDIDKSTLQKDVNYLISDRKSVRRTRDAAIEDYHRVVATLNRESSRSEHLLKENERLSTELTAARAVNVGPNNQLHEARNPLEEILSIRDDMTTSFESFQDDMTDFMRQLEELGGH
ncbi:hypothetical protein KKF82_08695 [Patescibacteria group bacterium]|nr:hypothetical protein [Patescibacteria group bacterium]